MLRDASHHHTIQKFSFIESISSSQSQDRYSQRDSIEQNTNGDSKFQQPTQTELAAQTDKNTPQQASALATTDDTVTIDTNWYQPEQDYSLSLAEILYATTNTSEPQTNSSPSNKLGKILFALACSYCLFVVWWVFGHQSHNLWVNLTGGKNIVLSKSDVEFIDYLERSLNKIDRDVAANKKSSEEVVYVPVYTPSVTPNQVASDVSNVPLISLPGTSTNIPTPPAPLPIPAPPPLPAPTPIATPEPDKAIASKPQISYALIGVLELGEGRSAALVKVQGKTRRVWIGEEIHADGWILESVGNQRANIIKGEQVRSLSVGETF